MKFHPSIRTAAVVIALGGLGFGLLGRLPDAPVLDRG
jgi:hypothetical protein